MKRQIVPAAPKFSIQPPPDIAVAINPLYPSIEPGTRVIARDRQNIGEVLDDLGSEALVRFVSQEGVSATKLLPKTILKFAESGRAVVAAAPALKIVPKDYHQLQQEFPELRPVVIDGLLRQGETLNLIAAPKVGKSFIAMGLAWACALGQQWLGFKVEQGKVLIIDNELHPETLAHRMQVVADALYVPADERELIAGAVLRGKNLSMEEIIERVEVPKNEYRLVVVDALYRTLPEGASENDNSAMAALYNLLDGFAERTGAAIVVVHHSSKGDQSGKGITDIGSGAGSISRAADVHATIQPHEQPGHCVFQAVTRSFKSPAPVTIKFDFPCWISLPSLEPEIKRPGRKDREQQEAEDRKAKQTLLDAVPPGKGITQSELSRKTGFGVDRLKRIAAMLENENRLVVSDLTENGGRQKTRLYSLPPTGNPTENPTGNF